MRDKTTSEPEISLWIRIMDECSICLEDKEPQDSFTLSECKHSCHKYCIALLITKSKYKLRCPDCRKILNRDKLRSAINGKKELICLGDVGPYWVPGFWYQRLSIYFPIITNAGIFCDEINERLFHLVSEDRDQPTPNSNQFDMLDSDDESLPDLSER